MPKGYLNDRGEPMATPASGGRSAAGGYLGDEGEPLADPLTAPTPHELNLHTPQKFSEPTTYAGGFWKGLKDYAKDLVSDPTTMAGVGSGIALATTPVTGPWGLAAAGALGAAGGAGGAHIVKQLRSGQAEDPLDVASSMGVEGAIGGAMTAIPPVAGKAGRYLVDRASRLAAPTASTTERAIASALRRHGPAALATHYGGPAAGLAVEAAQSPMVNRGVGRMLEGVGEIPDAMKSLMGRVSGAGRASALEEVAAARRPVMDRAMGIGRAEQPMRPWSPDAAYAEEAWPAAESVAAPRYRDQTGRSIPTAAELDEEFALGADPVENELLGGRRRMAEERHGIRPMSPPPEDALRRAMLSRQRYEAPSMAALVDEAPVLSEDLAVMPGLNREQFNQRFHQQLMESLSRGR